MEINLRHEYKRSTMDKVLVVPENTMTGRQLLQDLSCAKVIFGDKYTIELDGREGDTSVFCSKCGKEIQDDAKFCTNCGKAVRNAEVMQSTEQKKGEDVAQVLNSIQENRKANEKKAKKTLGVVLWLVLSVCIVLLIGVLISIFVSRDKESLIKQSATETITQVTTQEQETVITEEVVQIDMSTYTSQLERWKMQFEGYTLSIELQNTYDITIAEYEAAIANCDENVCVQCDSNLESLFVQAKEHEWKVAEVRNYYAGMLTGLQYEVDVEDEFNKYAILDIDADGIEELILDKTDGTYLAVDGTTETVYEYDLDTDTLVTELDISLTTDATQYYSDGVVRLNATRLIGHGMGDNMYYSVLVYNLQKDEYEIRFSVDTWERDFISEDFPEEHDKDGDGIVYWLEDYADETQSGYIDNAEYEAWYQSCFGGMKQIEIPWQTIASEKYKEYTNVYISFLLDKIKQKQLPEQTDMGLVYVENGDSFKAVEEMLSASFTVEFVEMGEGFGMEGLIEGESFYRSIWENATGIQYCNKQVGGLTVFGIYPGMVREEAVSMLEEYGFYKMRKNVYYTGDAFGNYIIYMESKDGIVQSIELRPYSGYAG